MDDKAWDPINNEALIGYAGFIITALLFIFVSNKAGMRAIGISTLIGAVFRIRDPRISYGWRGREPSGYIEGAPAIVIILLFTLIALVTVFNPTFMLEIYGWNK